MSAEREQMNLERRLMERARTSMKARDGAGVRKALSEYRKLRRTDHFVDWAQGYDVIASCLESANESATAKAEEFISAHRGSPLRRNVRRYCGVE